MTKSESMGSAEGGAQVALGLFDDVLVRGALAGAPEEWRDVSDSLALSPMVILGLGVGKTSSASKNHWRFLATTQ